MDTAGGPRPYSLLVVFTALGASYKCEICQQLNTQLIPLAQWYNMCCVRVGRVSLFNV